MVVKINVVKLTDRVVEEFKVALNELCHEKFPDPRIPSTIIVYIKRDYSRWRKVLVELARKSSKRDLLYVEQKLGFLATLISRTERECVK